jgi:hypothetical protein
MRRSARARFVQHALRDTRAALARLRERAAAPFADGDFEALSLRGSILELEARIRWLTGLGRRLGGPAPVATPIATARHPTRATRRGRR